MGMVGKAVLIGIPTSVGAGTAGIVSAFSDEKNDAKHSAITAGVIAGGGIGLGVAAMGAGLVMARIPVISDPFLAAFLFGGGLLTAAGSAAAGVGAGAVALAQRQ